MILGCGEIPFVTLGLDETGMKEVGVTTRNKDRLTEKRIIPITQRPILASCEGI